MSETLRELVVRLSLDSGSFSSQIKAANTAVKQAEANFKLAGAGISGFDKSLAGAQAKAVMLTSKLQAQNKAVDVSKKSLDANKAALEKNQKQQAKLAQDIDTAKKAYEAEVAATTKNSAASQVLAADLKKLEGQQVAVGKQAITQAADVNKSELALTEASAAAKKTEAELKKANKEVEKASMVWAKFGAATAGAQKALSSAGQKMSSAGRTMTMGLTVPIIAAATAAFAAFNTMDDGLDTIIRKTGATGDTLAGLETAYNNVFTGVKTTAADAGIAVGEVSTRFKVTGTALEDLSTLFIQFADVTQTDLNGSIQNTQKILSQFGLGAENAGGFLGLLTSESQRTGLSVDKLFDSLQANGATLKGMGLNLSQSIQMMANFEAAGINAEVAMAALKKSAATYSKEGKTLEEGFAGTVKAIQGAKTETQALAIAQKVFGVKGALEMATAIREGRLSVTGLTADMSEMGGTVSKVFGEINGDTPVLDRVKNKLIATGAQFGKALLPFIEQAAGKLGELVQGFTNLDPAMQQNILGFAGIAAAVGPALSMLGKMATGASALMKAFSGPAGWITLAVGALVGLGVAIASIPTSAQKVGKTLSEIKIGSGIIDQAGITAGINAGIDAANKEHDISLKITADTSGILTKLDEALKDDKLTGKEFKAISKYVKDIVNPDIQAAKEALDLKVAEYKASLDAAVNAEGKPLTKDEKKELVDAFTEKNGQAIADLEAGVKEMNRLLAVVRDAGSNATAQQIADLEAAIAKVAELRAAIQVTKDEAVQASKADYNLTVSGGGNTESAANAVGYVSQTRANEIADAEAIKQTALAASTTDAAAAQAAYVAYDAAVQAANEKAQAGYTAIAEGVAAGSTGATDMIDKAVKLGEQLTTLQGITKLTGTEFRTAFGTMFGPGGALEGYVDAEGANLYNSLFQMMMDSEPGTGDRLYAENQVTLQGQGIVGKVMETISAQIKATALDPTLNPMANLLKTLLDAGAFKAIDPTTVQGPLEEMLKLVDLKTQGEALGKQVPEGVAIGINSGAPTSLTKETLAPLKTALEDAVKAVLEIESPSKIMVPFGKQVPAGLAVGIVEGTGVFVSAIKELYAAAMNEADRQELILRNHLAWLASSRSGGGGNAGGSSGGSGAGNGGGNGGGGGSPITTYNDSVTVNANITNPTDVAVLAAQLDGRKRRINVGYGATS